MKNIIIISHAGNFGYVTGDDNMFYTCNMLGFSIFPGSYRSRISGVLIYDDNQ